MFVYQQVHGLLFWGHSGVMKGTLYAVVSLALYFVARTRQTQPDY